MLICLEQSERFAHSHSFDLSEMSEWANSQPWKLETSSNNCSYYPSKSVHYLTPELVLDGSSWKLKYREDIWLSLYISLYAAELGMCLLQCARGQGLCVKHQGAIFWTLRDALMHFRLEKVKFFKWLWIIITNNKTGVLYITFQCVQYNLFGKNFDSKLALIIERKKNSRQETFN